MILRNYFILEKTILGFENFWTMSLKFLFLETRNYEKIYYYMRNPSFWILKNMEILFWKS
jgi:hypothetical protein